LSLNDSGGDDLPPAFGFPTTTVFTRANLDAPNFSWFLSIDDLGAIVGLTFFMQAPLSTAEGPTNADGFSIEGFDGFEFYVCAGDAVANLCDRGSPKLDELLIAVQSVSPVTVVPEPATAVLACLALGALGARRRFARARWSRR
jgi:hypothetical protein